jgi:ATP/maltotriose-dependent transcriptional regulator MalT
MIDTMGDLLERADELAALTAALESVRAGSQGRVVLVAGEAGVGKTALVRRFADEQARAARVVSGACDALFTPRALGPLLDIAVDAGGELADVVASDSPPHQVTGALLRELAGRRPAVLVVEDVHWADDATLDVLRLLARRVEAAAVLVVVTYRDDELPLAHPLRIVLGELARTPRIDRVAVPRLSRAAVAELAEASSLDADELYRTTGGNPFFVTETLAAGDAELPHTVRDAVLARAGRLSPAARTLLEAVAIAQPQAEVWLLEALAPDHVDRLEACLSAGILMPTRDGVAFRHELARMAIEQAIAPDRALALHRAALAALAAPPTGASEPARLAHHAEAAGDADAVLRFAPAAAERAASVGAHREAAAQYARALRFGAGLPDAARVGLYEGRAREAFLADDCAEAIDAIEGALACHRALGDRVREADWLRVLADVLFCPGDRSDDGDRTAREAIAMLEPFGPSRELGLAYAQMAALRMNCEDEPGTLEWGERALAIAEQVDDVEVWVDTIDTIGTMELLLGRQEGYEKLQRSIGMAREAGLDARVVRGYGNVAWGTVRQRWMDAAEQCLADGIAYCSEGPRFDMWRHYYYAYRGRLELYQGRWTDAADSVSIVVADRRTSSIPLIVALAVLGTVRARRGDPEVAAPLAEARALAEMSYELQRIEPIAIARAEVAWLAGDTAGVAEATEGILEESRALGAGWVYGELASWRRRAGIDAGSAADADGPYALELAGKAKEAAAAWTALGCPYEAALALADDDDDASLRDALAQLQELGARPAAAIVARRLRERGVRGLPRGPIAATRDNPAGLTAREVEVLELVGEGLRNADIAERLFLAEKTVGHHVSAILRKLAVRTRGEATAEAQRLGIPVRPR